MRRFLTVLVAVALVVAVGGPAFGDNSRPASSPDHRITAMGYHGHWHHGDHWDHGYYGHRYYDDGYYGDYYARCRWAYYHDPYWFDHYCRGYY